MNSSSGARANISGSNFEKSIALLLIETGYKLVNAEEFDMRVSHGLTTDVGKENCFDEENGLEAVYAKQYIVGDSIYCKPRKCDFILFHPQKWPKRLVIECKWQQTSGTVEEKFPFLTECIKKTGIETIIILDGGGYSQGAEQWLRSQVGKGSLRSVFSWSEFMKFINDGGM